jgi:hypothetical protein
MVIETPMLTLLVSTFDDYGFCLLVCGCLRKLEVEMLRTCCAHALLPSLRSNQAFLAQMEKPRADSFV